MCYLKIILDLVHYEFWTCVPLLHRWYGGDNMRVMRFTHCFLHYGDVIMGAIASQITSLTIVCSTVYSDADQRKHQSSASLVFIRGIHRGPVNSPHKWPVTRKMCPFDDVIMLTQNWYSYANTNPRVLQICTNFIEIEHLLFWPTTSNTRKTP